MSPLDLRYNLHILLNLRVRDECLNGQAGEVGLKESGCHDVLKSHYYDFSVSQLLLVGLEDGSNLVQLLVSTCQD